MKIVILGGGSFGTSVAHQLSFNEKNEITLLVRSQDKADEISNNHSNSGYFPNRVLPEQIKASTDYNTIASAAVLMIAIPSRQIKTISSKIKAVLKPETLVVNLAKGILTDGETIIEHYQKEWKHTNFISMKGASFSADMINGLPTLFTVGFQKKNQLDNILKIVEQTNIYLDYTTDIRGVELVSALKNIYAIALGNVDAQYNSINTRFMMLTKAVDEIKIMMRSLGGLEETVFLSCGIGDISLTGLSDLSRNRTLGLLIGKGFYNQELSDNSVVLEGSKTVGMVDRIISERIKKRLPLFAKVKQMLANPGQSTNFEFQELFRKKYKTIITYGTFDLLHFGHLELLRRIKEMGDRIIVGLSTDEFNQKKGKKCIMSYEKRKNLLEVLSYVDLVIPEENWEQKAEDIQSHEADVLVMGNDWEGKFDDLNKYCEVVYLPRTKGISTTKLKALLKE